MYWCHLAGKLSNRIGGAEPFGVYLSTMHSIPNVNPNNLLFDNTLSGPLNGTAGSWYALQIDGYGPNRKP